MNVNERDDEYISIDDPSYFRKDDDWWWVELCNIFNNIPPNDKFDDQRSAGCAMQYIKSLETQIEALKRPNNVVGVPSDKLAEMQATIKQQQAEIEALKAKTLTDQEINKIYLEKYDWRLGFLSPDEIREFARAILRKAQKK